MKEYHKINSIFKRDDKGIILPDEFSQPEFEFLRNNTWVWTEKVDGTNIRVMWDGEEMTLRFGGKTANAQMPVFLYEKLQQLFTKEKFYGRGTMCLYGEGFGNRIQKAGKLYNSSGVDFVLFDIRIGEWWLIREVVDDFAKEIGIKSVPIVGEGTLDEAVMFVKNGFQSTWGNFPAEGLVLRPKVELQARGGQRIITKIKHSDFTKLEARLQEVKRGTVSNEGCAGSE